MNETEIKNPKLAQNVKLLTADNVKTSTVNVSYLNSVAPKMAMMNFKKNTPTKSYDYDNDREVYNITDEDLQVKYSIDSTIKIINPKTFKTSVLDFQNGNKLLGIETNKVLFIILSFLKNKNTEYVKTKKDEDLVDTIEFTLDDLEKEYTSYSSCNKKNQSMAGVYMAKSRLRKDLTLVINKLKDAHIDEYSEYSKKKGSKTYHVSYTLIFNKIEFENTDGQISFKLHWNKDFVKFALDQSGIYIHRCLFSVKSPDQFYLGINILKISTMFKNDANRPFKVSTLLGYTGINFTSDSNIARWTINIKKPLELCLDKLVEQGLFKWWNYEPCEPIEDPKKRKFKKSRKSSKFDTWMDSKIYFEFKDNPDQTGWKRRTQLKHELDIEKEKEKVVKSRYKYEKMINNLKENKNSKKPSD